MSTVIMADLNNLSHRRWFEPWNREIDTMAKEDSPWEPEVLVHMAA